MNVWIFLWLNLKNIENKMDSFEFEKYIADAEYICSRTKQLLTKHNSC